MCTVGLHDEVEASRVSSIEWLGLIRRPCSTHAQEDINVAMAVSFALV